LFQAAKRFVSVQAEIIFVGGIGLGEHGNTRARAEELLPGAADKKHVDILVHARLENGGVELLHHFVAVGVGGGIVQFENRDAVFDAVSDELFASDCRCGCHIWNVPVYASQDTSIEQS
jgi:hypothetical protein